MGWGSGGCCCGVADGVLRYSNTYGVNPVNYWYSERLILS